MRGLRNIFLLLIVVKGKRKLKYSFPSIPWRELNANVDEKYYIVYKCECIKMKERWGMKYLNNLKN